MFLLITPAPLRFPIFFGQYGLEVGDLVAKRLVIILSPLPKTCHLPSLNHEQHLYSHVNTHSSRPVIWEASGTSKR